MKKIKKDVSGKVIVIIISTQIVVVCSGALTDFHPFLPIQSIPIDPIHPVPLIQKAIVLSIKAIIYRSI